jgi:hypothetical protein
MIIIGLESPAWLERSRRQASKEAWNPEAHATFVGFRGAGAARPCNRPANDRKPSRAVSAIALRDINLQIADTKYSRHEPPPPRNAASEKNCIQLRRILW